MFFTDASGVLDLLQDNMQPDHDDKNYAWVWYASSLYNYDQSVIVMSPDIKLEHDKILVVAAEVARPRWTRSLLSPCGWL